MICLMLVCVRCRWMVWLLKVVLLVLVYSVLISFCVFMMVLLGLLMWNMKL